MSVLALALFLFFFFFSRPNEECHNDNKKETAIPFGFLSLPFCLLPHKHNLLKGSCQRSKNGTGSPVTVLFTLRPPPQLFQAYSVTPVPMRAATEPCRSS